MGISIDEVLCGISYEDFLLWTQYFSYRPIGWREDFRAGMIMKAFGVKEKLAGLFPTIAAIERANNIPQDDPDGTDFKGLKGSYLFRQLQMAVGGDRLRL